jgi:hypothetical protein
MRQVLERQMEGPMADWRGLTVQRIRLAGRRSDRQSN